MAKSFGNKGGGEAPASLDFSMGSGGPPADKYTATFDGVVGSNHEMWGAGLRWEFVICKGPLKGETASRTTKPRPTAKNSCGRMIRDLLGRKVEAGESVSVADLVGCKFKIVVEETDSGSTRIERVERLDNEEYPDRVNADVDDDEDDDDDSE